MASTYRRLFFASTNRMGSGCRHKCFYVVLFAPPNAVVENHPWRCWPKGQDWTCPILDTASEGMIRLYQAEVRSRPAVFRTHYSLVGSTELSNRMREEVLSSRYAPQ
jgi:hypothetical protein